MAYPANTVLSRSEPLPDIEVARNTYNRQGSATGTKLVAQPHPHNKLRVVGPSPISSASLAEWEGIGGDHIIVAPAAEFGANEIIPEAVLIRDYDVLEYGDEALPEKIVLDPPRGIGSKAETPEQAFTRQARESKKKAASVA